MHIIITSLFVRVGGGGRKSKKKRYEKKIKWRILIKGGGGGEKLGEGETPKQLVRVGSA